MIIKQLGKRFWIALKTLIFVALFTLSCSAYAEYFFVYSATDLGCGGCGGYGDSYYDSYCTECEHPANQIEMYGSGETLEYAWVPDPADP